MNVLNKENGRREWRRIALVDRSLSLSSIYGT